MGLSWLSASCRVFAGESLRSAFATFSTKLQDARDRALLSSLMHEGSRWWLRYDKAVDRLLERPLREREPQLHALLVLGLVQLDVLRMPEYAAVAATVDGARALRKPKFAGLVNAVLRRWLRERDALIAGLDADLVTRSAHPCRLIDRLDQVADRRRDSRRVVVPALAVRRRRLSTKVMLLG